MSGPFHPRKVYRVAVPDVVGHEMRDNPEGARPWVVLYARSHQQTGLVMAAPLGSKPPHDLPDCVLLMDDDWSNSPSADALIGQGWVHLHQSRALAKERIDLTSGPMATLHEEAVERLRAHLRGLLASGRMDRASRR